MAYKDKKDLYKYQIKRWIDRKKKAIIYKGSKCKDCGGKFHYSVFDFHHVGEKIAGWPKMRLWSWDKVLKELDKCVLLCANCHRLRHYDNNS